MKHPLNIYDILEALEKRKAMYLGNDYTFRSLDNFITGFTMAAQDVQLEMPDIPNFTYFSTWIIGHFDQHYGLSGGWHWQIHNRNLNDDQKTFQEFFYFLDIFKNSKVTSKILVVDQQAIQFSIDSHVSHYSVNEKKDELVEKKPFKIRWIQISNSTTVWIEFLDKNSDSISEHWYFVYSTVVWATVLLQGWAILYGILGPRDYFFTAAFFHLNCDKEENRHSDTFY